MPCCTTAQAPGGGPYREAVGRLRQQMADVVAPQSSNGGGGGSGEVEVDGPGGCGVLLQPELVLVGWVGTWPVGHGEGQGRAGRIMVRWCWVGE